MQKIIHFIKYNNTLPIILGVIFLGATGALAASEEVREVVVATDVVVRTIDNTRIVNVDFDTYTVTVEVVGVEEDADDYYVTYILNTIEVHDGAWIDVAKEDVMQVSKEGLGGGDLGLYLSEELAELRGYNLRELKQAQLDERKSGVSNKTVATVYSGLVGKFLDEKEESFPGYQPVVVPKWEPTISTPPIEPTQEPTPEDTTVIVGDPSDTEAPVVTVLGNNPARITLNTNYSDLGAYVTDNISNNIGYIVFLDGTEVSTVDIDTSTTTTYTITYRATDQVGNSGEATRIVEVYDPNVVVTPEPVATTTLPVATTTPEVEPVEEPEPVVEETATTTLPVAEEPPVEEPVATSTPPVVEEPEPVVEEPVATTTIPVVEVSGEVASST